MKNVKFNVCGTRTQQFTPTQLAKVQKGIEIFEKVVNSPTFQQKVSNYTWTTPGGTTYNRFHMSQGMSNQQVWDCINNCTTCLGVSTNDTVNFNVVPCTNRTDMMSCVNNPSWCIPQGASRASSVTTTTATPCLCINVNCLNDDYYTAVHVASALMHEYCVNIGFCCTWNGAMTRNCLNTVPMACATLLMECCETVCAGDSSVVNCFNNINTREYDYCAASVCFNIEGWETSCTTACTQINATINCLETELCCLTDLATKTSEEVNRMTTVTNCLTSLKNMRANLYNTSLDGCDSVGTAVCGVTEVAYAN